MVTAGLAVGVVCAATVTAEDTPLAECKLQAVAVAAPAEMQPGIMLPSAERPEAIIAANYRQGPAGDWEVPGSIDDEDASIRFLLATPDGPLLVEVTVLVDGESFRATRERMIEDAFAGVSDETPGPEVEESKSASDNAGNSSDTEEERNRADDANESKEDKVPTTAVQRYQLNDALTRLKKYVNQPGIDVSREEARWLLAQWAPGADLLELRPNFAAERAHMAPLWAALDRNHDNSLTEAEVGSSGARLRALDRDEDDWVDESELIENVSPLVASWASLPLMTLLNETTEWELLADAIREAASGQLSSNGSPPTNSLLTALGIQSVSDVDSRRLRRLADTPAQVTIRVSFSTRSGTSTGVAVTRVDQALISEQDLVIAAERVITLPLAHCLLELSAAQPGGTASAAAWNGQVALGAVIDGSPLMRMIDTDNDHRLSLREIDAVSDAIAALDSNSDGTVQLAEVPVPIRLMVTRGPHVHELLDDSTSATGRGTPAKSVLAPDWFASMDRNKDNDLTPAEFLGTREQFDLLDTDGDQRVSAREAMASAAAKK